jgi:D-sedoheptulose 7-phosphate isomerase
MSEEFIDRAINDHVRIIETLRSLTGAIDDAARLCATALRDGGKVVFCGNGGSAADGQHLAGELMGRLRGSRRPLAALALSGDSAVTTCIANDFGYEEVFARQVEGICRPGDVLIAMSTSGTSSNVICAVRAANRRGVTTIGLTGGTGGALAGECAVTLCISHTTDTARIQEAHMLIGHTVCALIERYLDLEPAPGTGPGRAIMK